MFNWSDLTADFIQKSVSEANEMSGGGFKDFTEDGEYNVRIKKVDDSERNGQKRLSLLLAADTGESGWFNLNLYHANPTAAKIAAQHLAIIAANAGKAVRGPKDLEGVQFQVGVKMKEWGDKVFPNFTPRTPKGGVKQAAPAPQPKPVAPAQAQVSAQAVDIDDDIPF